MSILKLTNIEKSFGKQHVLKGVNLEINKGEVITVLGKSGSGKSTLLNIIAGFEKEDIGEVVVSGDTLSDLKITVLPEDRNIGFVFQNYALFPHLNIYENVTFGVKSKDKTIKLEKCKKLLSLIGLDGYEKKFPHETSGGEQQRIALIRSLATDPNLLLLDEPFSNIDGSIKHKIQKELLEVLRSHNQTALIVTHDPHEAMSLSDRIVFLEEGKIVQYDTPENIYNNPATENVAKTFGIANFIEKYGKKYCVRSEYCTLDESNGEFSGKILSKYYLGDRTLYGVEFDYAGEKIEFQIYSTSLFHEGNSIYLNINWDKVVTIS